MTHIKTFRGLLKDATQDIIVLHTNNGSTGYRMVKFQLMSPTPSTNIESVVKIYTVPQVTTAIDFQINFNDQTLLAVGLITQSSSGHNYPEDQTIVFDNSIINQDIYIVLKGADYTSDVNYYIELEQIKLDLNENTVATLKDIRNLA